jgi:hypothetical protein
MAGWAARLAVTVGWAGLESGSRRDSDANLGPDLTDNPLRIIHIGVKVGDESSETFSLRRMHQPLQLGGRAAFGTTSASITRR